MQRSTHPELAIPSSSQHPDPDNRPGKRRRSCREQPVEGEETPAIRKRGKTETEDKRLDGNDEMIWPSGEPSCHLSACPVPLVTNSALTINTEASHDLYSQTPTSLHDPSLAISNVAKMHVNSISPLSTPHRSSDQDTKRLEIPHTMDFQQSRRSNTIIPPPSMGYPRKTWWNNLLDSYPPPSRTQLYALPFKSLHEPQFNTTLVKGVGANLSLL